MPGLDEKLLKVIEKHHAILLQKMLGTANSGLHEHEVQGKPVPAPAVDGVHLAIATGREQERLSELGDAPAQRQARSLPLPDAVARILREAVKQRNAPPTSHPAHAVPGAVSLEHGVHAYEAEAPEPKPVDWKPLPPRDIPKGITGPFADLYARYTGRIGEYCKGLGAAWSEDLKDWVGETWNGDAPSHVPDPDERQRKIAIIRAEVLKEMTGARSPSALARRLAVLTGDMARNWRRIALTELQACMNEAVILQAVERRGKDARIARVPESRACPSCRDLFLSPGGKPKLWSPEQLLRNGTNVGVPKHAWKATLFPVHPCCCCGTVSVPPGMEVDADGLVRHAISRRYLRG